MGPGGEEVAGRLAEAGLDVVGVDGRAGRWGVPLLGMRPVEDDDPGRRPAGRGPAGPGMAGDGRVRPGGPRWPGASATRPPTTGTTRWPSSASRPRAAGWSGAGAGSRARTGWWWATASSRPPGPWSQHRRPGLGPAHGRAGRHPYWTNREIIEAEDVPASLAVLGGGAIGVELAQVSPGSGSR